MLDDTVVMVLAGGAGERLYPLTKERAKPAVYFGGPYRIIDFTLSNCINSGLRASSSRRSTSRCRSTATSAWAGASSPRSSASSSRSSAAEAGRRALVSGHGRRGLPEPLLDPARESAPPDRAVRRSRLQDGLRARCCASIRSAAPAPRWRRSRCRRRRRIASASLQVDDEGARHRLPGEAQRTCRSRRTQVLASMGIYIFDSDVLVPALEADARAADQPRFRQGHHPGADRPRCRSTPTASTTRTRRRRSTGATSARSTRTSKRTWICAR